MGVKDLWSLVAPCESALAGDALRGKVIAVDASVWIQQAVRGVRARNSNRGGGGSSRLEDMHMIVIFRRIVRLMELGAKLVFVFDGKPPAVKRRLLESRRKRRLIGHACARQAAEKLRAVKDAIGLGEMEDGPPDSSSASDAGSEDSVGSFADMNVGVARLDLDAVTELPYKAQRKLLRSAHQEVQEDRMARSKAILGEQSDTAPKDFSAQQMSAFLAHTRLRIKATSLREAVGESFKRKLVESGTELRPSDGVDVAQLKRIRGEEDRYFYMGPRRREAGELLPATHPQRAEGAGRDTLQPAGPPQDNHREQHPAQPAADDAASDVDMADLEAALAQSLEEAAAPQQQRSTTPCSPPAVPDGAGGGGGGFFGGSEEGQQQEQLEEDERRSPPTVPAGVAETEAALCGGGGFFGSEEGQQQQLEEEQRSPPAVPAVAETEAALCGGGGFFGSEEGQQEDEDMAEAAADGPPCPDVDMPPGGGGFYSSEGGAGGAGQQAVQGMVQAPDAGGGGGGFFAGGGGGSDVGMEEEESEEEEGGGGGGAMQGGGGLMRMTTDMEEMNDDELAALGLLPQADAQEGAQWGMSAGLQQQQQVEAAPPPPCGIEAGPDPADESSEDWESLSEWGQGQQQQQGGVLDSQEGGEADAKAEAEGTAPQEVPQSPPPPPAGVAAAPPAAAQQVEEEQEPCAAGRGVAAEGAGLHPQQAPPPPAAAEPPRTPAGPAGGDADADSDDIFASPAAAAAQGGAQPHPEHTPLPPVPQGMGGGGESPAETAPVPVTPGSTERRRLQYMTLQQAVALQQEKLDALRKSGANIAEGMVGDMCHLLDLFGIPYITSPGEADSQLGAMSRAGLVDVVATEDSDVLLFGAKRVVRGLGTRNSSQARDVEACNIEQQLGLSRKHLVALAMLVGSDYTEGLSNVGMNAAQHLLLGMHVPDEEDEATYLSLVMARVTSFMAAIEAAQASAATPGGAKGKKKVVQTAAPGACLFDKVQAHALNALGTRQALRSLDPHFPNENVVSAYLHPAVDDAEEMFTWGQPMWKELIEYGVQTVGMPRPDVERMITAVQFRTDFNAFPSSAPLAFCESAPLSQMASVLAALLRLSTHDYTPEHIAVLRAYLASRPRLTSAVKEGVDTAPNLLAVMRAIEFLKTTGPEALLPRCCLAG